MKLMEMEKKQKQYEKHSKVVKEQVQSYKTEKQMADRQVSQKKLEQKNKIINEKKRMIVLNRPTVQKRQYQQYMKLVK